MAVWLNFRAVAVPGITERHFQMLKGYKTYITALLAVAGAVGAYLTGEMSITDAVQIIVPALIGAFVRNGMA